ncbi:hypothetical protein RJ641_018791 [Dillenia turbinata]|uniref:Serine aminopeptidase S33 domain-containing protein n=1 Tax=Dillenia turbinata TaxID=194707 RepID=A0AAN8YXJ2_9MAGN
MDCPAESTNLDSAISAYQHLLRCLSLIPISHYFLGICFLLLTFLYFFWEMHFLQDFFTGFRGDPVVLTFDPSSQVYEEVVSKCKLLHGRFQPTPWLSSPHLQTAFMSFFGNSPSFSYKREIFHTPDGGTLALDWLISSDIGGIALHKNQMINKEDKTPVVVVVPGLTSDSEAPYIKHLVFKIAKRGWNVVVSNHRGLGGVSITDSGSMQKSVKMCDGFPFLVFELLSVTKGIEGVDNIVHVLMLYIVEEEDDALSDCFYTGGWTEDVRIVVKYLHGQFPDAPLFAVGTSIGANVLVKYLGEEGYDLPLVGAAAVGSPWDLVVVLYEKFMLDEIQRFSGSLHFKQFSLGDSVLVSFLLICAPVVLMMGSRFLIRKHQQRFYDRFLTSGLKRYAQLHQHALSRIINYEAVQKSRCVRDFDKYATRVMAKFRTVDAYYRHSSSVNFVEDVSVPLLCISAVNDPVCTGEAIPYDECRNNKNVVLATTKHGGHLAYYEGITATSLWWVRAVDEFLSVLHSSPFVLGKKEVQSSSSPSSTDPSVDQGRFVNIIKDGAVAELGSEQRNGEVEDAHHDHLLKTTKDNDTAPGVIE